MQTNNELERCISFDSYIKPQLILMISLEQVRCISFDSYIKPQRKLWLYGSFQVVYLLIPTSNHNPSSLPIAERLLYIFWFLHQTTTIFNLICSTMCCISFDSYIKPQPCRRWVVFGCVVYLLIPTSNHNKLVVFKNNLELYIFWFLHQTTTSAISWLMLFSCISFDSYIKPQPNSGVTDGLLSCISFDSYIKPQLIDLKVLISSV